MQGRAEPAVAAGYGYQCLARSLAHNRLNLTFTDLCSSHLSSDRKECVIVGGAS